MYPYTAYFITQLNSLVSKEHLVMFQRATHCLFKEAMGIENYVKYNLSSSKKICKCHNLLDLEFYQWILNPGDSEIKLYADEKLCTLCEFDHDAIEYESHFLFQCSL